MGGFRDIQDSQKCSRIHPSYYCLKSERNSRNSSYVYFSVPHIDENQIVRLVEELLWLSFELMLHFEIPYYFNEPS